MGLIGLGVSLLGYGWTLKRRWNIHFAFIPVILISIHITVLFVAGLLNILKIMSWMLMGFGVVLAVYEAVWAIRKKELPHMIPSEWMALVIYGVMCVGFVLVLRGALFTKFDDFTHWATMVKRMLGADAFPNFEIPIGFKDYPPGAALWVYYLNTIATASEGRMMMAQAAFAASGALTIFAFAGNDEKWNLTGALRGIIASVATIFLTVCINGINSLYVDTLLTTTFLAASLIIMYNWKDPLRGCKIVCPVLCALALIKHTGVFLVVFALSLSVWAMISRRKTMSKKDWLGLLAFAVSFTFVFLWHKHVEMVFPSSSSSKHSMDMGNFTIQLSYKTVEDMRQIGINLLNYITNWDDIHVKTVALSFGIFTLMLIITSIKKGMKAPWGVLVWCAVILVTYVFGVYVMYLVSMPLGEAIVLGSFDRYLPVAVYGALGIMLATCLKLSQDLQVGWRKWGLTIGMAALLLCTLRTPEYYNVNYSPTDYENSRRHDLDRAASSLNRTLVDHDQLHSFSKTYVVYMPVGYYEYYVHMGRFVLNTMNVKVIEKASTPQEIADFVASVNPDYLIVVDVDEGIDEYTMGRFGSSGRGTYHIEK